MCPPMFWIPKGANPAGTDGSLNEPAGVTSWKLPSKTSTRLLWKSVANNSSPFDDDASARPLKTAPLAESSTATIAWVGETDLFQPRIFPASVAKRNVAAPDAPPFETTKLEPALATAPVGAFGTWTTSGVPAGKAAPSAV